jgi:hypothetical protein
MILPGKHLRHDRAMLSIGADILAQLDQPRTVSELWEQVRRSRAMESSLLTFDWFILSLSFLYAISAVEDALGLVQVKARP